MSARLEGVELFSCWHNTVVEYFYIEIHYELFCQMSHGSVVVHMMLLSTDLQHVG